MAMSVKKAFHDFVNKGRFILNNHNLFFVKDGDLSRVGYDPAQYGYLPLSDSELSHLLANDRSNWIRANLKQIGYLI